MKHSCQNVRGFTLIELLAVVAIILILLSLLLPGLSSMRERANVVVCESNVRQVQAAITHYAVDNNGATCSPNWLSGDAIERGWLTSANGWPNPTVVKSGLLWPYLGTEKVYRCPADPQPSDGTGIFNYPNSTRMVTSYNMNGSPCGYGKAGYDWTAHIWNTYTLTSFRPTDIIYWEGDEATDIKGWWWDGANFPNEGISARHTGAGVVASIDGHVERMMSADYYLIVADPKKNRLWNNPVTSNGH